MGNCVDLFHMSEEQESEGKRVIRHHFMMQDDYEYRDGHITFEHDSETPISNELIFLLARRTDSGEMLMVAEEKGGLYINDRFCELDRCLLRKLRRQYARQLDEEMDEVETV